MTTLLRKQTKVRKRSNYRPKSLILLIPAVIRDLLELSSDDDVCLEVCMENEEKYLKLKKID